MTRRPYRSCMPLHLMDSNPRDEEPDEPVPEHEDYDDETEDDPRIEPTRWAGRNYP